MLLRHVQAEMFCGAEINAMGSDAGGAKETMVRWGATLEVRTIRGKVE